MFKLYQQQHQKTVNKISIMNKIHQKCLFLLCYSIFGETHKKNIFKQGANTLIVQHYTYGKISARKRQQLSLSVAFMTDGRFSLLFFSTIRQNVNCNTCYIRDLFSFELCVATVIACTDKPNPV